MPDDPPVTQGGTQQGNPLNVREGQVGTLSVTRMDVATGQVKDLQVDLLREIRDATKETGDRDTTLQASLKEMNKSLRTLVGKTTPGGGEGAEPSVQGMLTHLKKTEEEFKALHDILKSDRIEFKKWGKLFTEGIRIQRQANFREFNEQIFRTTQSLADLRSGITKVWGETKNLFELSQTGLLEVTAIFEDIAAGQLRNRDALKTTVPTIIEMAERGRMLMGTLGDSAAEIATAFKANREIVEKAGIDLKRIPFEQQNEILADILINQRRVGVQGDNREILQSRAAREQLEHLQQISFMTGISAKELMKMNVEERKTFEELAGLGIISAEQITTMTNLSQKMGLTGQDVAADFFKEALSTQGGLPALLSGSAGLQMFAAQGNNRQIIADAYAMFQRTDLDAPTQAKNMQEILSQLEDMSSSVGLGRAAFEEGGGRLSQMMFAARGLIPLEGEGTKGGGFTGVAEKLIEANTSTGSKITGVINELREWLAANVGPFSGLAVAMALHTPAMIAHSIAIGGSAIKSAFNFLRGKGGGMTLETAGQATKRVATQNAAKTGGRAALGTAARVGATALGGTAAVAGAGALGYLIGQEVVAPLINAAIASATGVEGATLGTTNVARGFFGAIPGLRHVEDQEQKKKIDAEVKRIREFHAKKKAQREAVAKGVSPVKGINPSIGDPATVSPADAEGRKPKTIPPDDPMLAQLVSQNTHLMSIVTLLTTSNELGLDMIDGIGAITTDVATPNTRRRVRGANTAAFSDFQSPGEGLE